jgi:putative flippase GtrA
VPFKDRQFWAFLLTGGFAAGVNIVSRYLLSRALSYEVAIVIAYLIGMTTAWALARLFVFQKSGRSHAEEYVRFAIVNVAGVIQVFVISVGLADYVFPAVGFAWHAEDVAHVIGVAAPIFTSYLGHKYFSFAPKKA